MRWARRTQVKMGLTVATPWLLGCALGTLIAHATVSSSGSVATARASAVERSTGVPQIPFLTRRRNSRRKSRGSVF